ncbi:hypothetical protein F2P81_018613 [Scophthalmus maximus]|uniref:Uncharacterized protein n=1 Tax=Scophthalmus maximus TaxID=52904 RepID=A0A6A4SB53_SCOMX|nr:hypothetical protein F2P81_018613 [Scophthalmus maximus]
MSPEPHLKTHAVLRTPYLPQGVSSDTEEVHSGPHILVYGATVSVCVRAMEKNITSANMRPMCLCGVMLQKRAYVIKDYWTVQACVGPVKQHICSSCKDVDLKPFGLRDVHWSVSSEHGVLNNPSSLAKSPRKKKASKFHQKLGHSKSHLRSLHQRVMDKGTEQERLREWTLFELAHAGLAGDKQQNTERRPNTIIRIIYKLANPVIIRYLKQSVPDEAKEQEKRLKALSPALTDLLRAEADCLLFKSTYEYIFVDVASEPSSSPLTLKMRPQPEDNG